MTALLQQIPLDRLLLWVFLAGSLAREVKAARGSLRAHGERLGSLEQRIAALEASRSHGG
jgi:hypothetical protein